MNRLMNYFQKKSAELRRSLKHDLKVFPFSRVARDALLLLVALQLILLGVNWINSGGPILGLRLEGGLVGQLAGPDFRKQADAIVYSYENSSLPVKVADEKSAITLRQLGVSVDKKQLHAKLLAEGREGSAPARVADQNMASLGILDVSLGHPNFDTELAKAYIATLDQKIDIAPVNAHFAFENQKAILRLDKPGRAIDVDAAIRALRAADPPSGHQVVLPTKETPAAVDAQMLNPLLPQVQAISQKPLTITAGESRTTLSPEQLVALVVPKVTPSPKDAKKSVVQITFDETKLNAVVDEVIGRAVVTPKPTIMSGDRVVQQGKDGVRTEDSNSMARVLTALLQRQTGAAMPDEVNIPLVTVSPPVVHQVQQVTNSPRTRTGTGLVRLTFDDGPGGYTEQILDILKRYNVHATFYVIGRNVYSYPGSMQRTKAEGHKICNHSFSHPDLSYLSAAGVTKELSDTNAAIRQTTGITPNCFRPPYGSHNQTVRSVAANMGMSVDMWSIDTRDWARPGSGAITRRVLDNTHGGAVVLLHVLNQQTVDALPSIIQGIRAQGYTLE